MSADSCLYEEIVNPVTLWTISFSIGVGTLSFATVLGSTPLDQLGNRPFGRGLLQWFWNGLLRGTGVRGYDSSLGALSPGCRILLHMAGMCAFWASTTLAMPHELLSRPECVAEVKLAVFFSAITSVPTYFFGVWALQHMLPNVSHPGGKRAHKIQRQPQWDQPTKTLDPQLVKRWRCAVAQDAHQATETAFVGCNGEGRLTGEPVGRQLWTDVPSSSDTKTDSSKSYMGLFGGSAIDDAKVQAMASGGRSEAGFTASNNPNSCDMIFRAQQIRSYLQAGQTPPDSSTKPKTASEAAKKGAHFYSMLQTEDGHWAGDYGGPHFLLPGLIVAWYVMGQPDSMLGKDQRSMMQHYITVHQQKDGGWGTHIESPSTMFGTTLMYVAIRLLGAPADDPVCQRARAFLQENGGAVMTGSWAKFYLCLLGCMEWDGHNSVPAELWLLPKWFPFHPGRLWCHCRMVYLPMGYLYGHRFVYSKSETDPTIASLRKELYVTPYESIEWIKTRHWVSPMDNYSPIPFAMRALQNILARYETWSIFQPFKRYVRKMGLKWSAEYMAAEDLQTNFIDIGPVNKVFNMLGAFHGAGGDLTHPTVVNHMMRVPDYLWIAEDGMKMQGYNGSQAWDTSFAIQAYTEANLLNNFPRVAKSAYSFLERTQILSTDTARSSPAYEYEAPYNREKFYRHVSEGGWPFSTSAHGWPISDCTGEGLKGTLCLLRNEIVLKALDDGELKRFTNDRFEKCVNVMLTLQNEDGGWATYENNRGFGWYEELNPSEVFGDIMIDYSYVECSMATLTALYEFHEMFPDHRREEVLHAINKGKDFLKSIQREDGSWYGSWACCFCYGCWFGVEGLVKAGDPHDSPEIQKCCEFLLAHQRENGGWGEDFTSCYDKDYAVNGMDAYGDEGSGVVNTSWALLALSAAKCKDVKAIQAGCQYLMKRQLPSGDWPQEGIAGVFNRACGITYTAYRNVFPIWALGRCAATYGDALENKI